MRGQAVWAAVLVLLQVLGCCCAFGSYPGTFYQMMLLLNKERKYARKAPSPSRLWAVFNPAASLGSLSNVPLDSNRVVRRDLEVRQVKESTAQEPPAEGHQPLSGEPSGSFEPASERQEHTGGGSNSTDGGLGAAGEGSGDTSGGAESTSGGTGSVSGGSSATSGGSDVASGGSESAGGGSGSISGGSSATSGVSDAISGGSESSSGGSGSISGGSSATSGVSDPISGGSESSSGDSESITGGSSATSGVLNEASEPTDNRPNGESESTNKVSDATVGVPEPVTVESETTDGGSEPAAIESETTYEGNEPTEPTIEQSDPISGLEGGASSLEGEAVGCGGEVVMPTPASITLKKSFTIKRNLSSPGWDKKRYPQGMDCVWNLKVGQECEVGLLLYQVLEGEVLQSPRCLRDYLEFVQPNSHSTRYCGPLVNNRDKVSGIDSWHSSQERITTIRFRSTTLNSLQDRSLSGSPRGFLMEVTYYCWLFTDGTTTTTQANEVSGGEQPDEGRKEENTEKRGESGDNNEKSEDNIEESEGSGQGSNGNETLI